MSNFFALQKMQPRYVPGLKTAANTDNTPSWNTLWKGLPGDIDDPLVGYLYFTDFSNHPLSTISASGEEQGWTMTEVDGGSVGMVDDVGHLLRITAGTAGADDGYNIQLSGETWKPAANKTLWFEARVRPSHTATVDQHFVGLHSTDTTIIASGVIGVSSDYYIGFHQDANTATSTYWEFAGCDNTSSTPDIDAATVAAGTWIKLGFKVTGTALGSLVCTPYVNGVAGTAISSDDVPETEMCISLVCQKENNNCYLDVDWIACAQLV